MIIAIYGPDSMGCYHSEKFYAGDAIPQSRIFCNQMLYLHQIK